jgi:hypothetical protein
MAVLDEQRNILLEEAIQELLDENINPTVELVAERLAAKLEETPLEEPIFDDTSALVTSHTSSSAELSNTTNTLILSDLLTLYRSMFLLTNDSMKSFDRWRAEMQRLESQLDSLDNRVANLLLITQDTEGYFNFVSDNFVDTEKIDLENSDVVVDLGRELVTVGPNNPGATRVFLNNLKDEDTVFTVLSQKNFQSVVDAPGSDETFAFDDTSKYWQSRVYMTVPGPVVAEFKVKLGDSPVKLSRITVKLHAANNTSSIQITPLLSTDNFNFSQLPTENFSLSVLRTATFSFTETEATHIKFLMTKEGFDTVDNLAYVYEFGADEISLFSEGFAGDTTAILLSKPLSILGPDGQIAEFNRVTLETCELIPEETIINYFVAATTTTTPPTGDDWVPIDPLNRTDPINPIAINFADLVALEAGVDPLLYPDWIKTSYDSDNDPTTDPEFSNPAADFQLIELSGFTLAVGAELANGMRYMLPTNSDRILDHQIKADVPMDEARLTVLRNLGLKGNKLTVRGIQTGWGFSEPFFSTVAEVKNKDGFDINFGDASVIIDGVSTKGQVHLDQGFHTIQTHKNNWVDVPNSLTILADLKDEDPLYPFNHKLLIEGYLYDGGWTEEEVYPGVDLFAETRMRQISPFDLLRSLPNNDYAKFALDLDVRDGAREPSRVIIVKTDATSPDFQNERFVLRFKADTGALLFKYVWLRADFVTNNPSVAPALDNYLIKLAK